MAEPGDALLDALALVAPGTPFREGLDRVLQAKRGALVVIDDGPSVLAICTGGFALDAEFTPQRLSELAKMDGAIVLDPNASRIVRANAHLMPRASIPTSETGTRHRTAERVARSLGVPVVTVSEAMSTITVYRGSARHTLQQPARLIDRATQALAAAERFKSRFDLALAVLSTLEVEDTASVSDVVGVLQPGEMVLRFVEEIEGYLVELGEDGRLIRMQIEELGAGVDEALGLVALDYVVVPSEPGAGGPDSGQPEGNGVHPGRAARGDLEREHVSLLRRRADSALAALHGLSHEELLGRTPVASVLGFDPVPDVLDTPVEARGYRLLHRLPRVSEAIIERIVARFATLPRLMQASLADLEKVGGVGEAKARSVKDGLSRMVEATILERYE
ncbi:MAG: DNA integrity scanning diadenylate cyclase DisA [Actinomycetota bacterium]|nr:DNA integrity scanning diadenylate cyclase DisA [Actinomycetota bacterium]